MRSRHRLGKLLLRPGIVYKEGNAWMAGWCRSLALLEAELMDSWGLYRPLQPAHISLTVRRQPTCSPDQQATPEH